MGYDIPATCAKSRPICQKTKIFLHSVCFERFARIWVQGFITVLSEAFESLQSQPRFLVLIDGSVDKAMTSKRIWTTICDQPHLQFLNFID